MDPTHLGSLVKDWEHEQGAFRPVVSARPNIQGAVGRLPRVEDAAFVPLAKRKWFASL